MLSQRYYLEKAGAPETQRAIALMRGSSFRAVARVRYNIVGQDRVLEQLFKVLSIHTRQRTAPPIVVMLTGENHDLYETSCTITEAKNSIGISGHGKSLLASKCRFA